MAAMPTQIWIRTHGKNPPEWVDAFMATGRVADDGSFDIASPGGPVPVNVGDAVFVFGGEAYVCPPRLMQDKLREIAPAETKAIESAPAISPAHAASYVDRGKRDAKAVASTPRFKPVIGAPCTPANIPIDQLMIDDSYQRSIEGGASQKAILKYATGWDWRLCLPLLGSRRRDGKIYIIDGQHRVEAARLRGDIPWLPVVIFDLDDPKQEAELFVAANRSRRPMGQLDDFHAAIVAGDPKATAISAAIEEAGLTVARNTGWQMLKAGEVMFIRTVDRAIKNYGRKISVAALAMIGRAFTDQPLIGGGALFDGLVCIVGKAEKAGEPIEFDLMEVVLAEVGLSGWKDAIANVESGAERNEVMQRELRKAYDEARAQ